MMALSTDNLKEIREAVERLQDLPSRVREVEVSGHLIRLSRAEDGAYQIRGIEQLRDGDSGPTYRSPGR